MARPLKEKADVFDALGNAQRRAILTRLKRGPTSVAELAELTGLLPPALSAHLRRLREVGLVEQQRKGAQVMYGLRTAALKAAAKWLAKLAK